jgi:hypothetical protein
LAILRLLSLACHGLDGQELLLLLPERKRRCRSGRMDDGHHRRDEARSRLVGAQMVVLFVVCLTVWSSICLRINLQVQIWSVRCSRDTASTSPIAVWSHKHIDLVGGRRVERAIDAAPQGAHEPEQKHGCQNAHQQVAQ